jgi:hypothetical protein
VQKGRVHYRAGFMFLWSRLKYEAGICSGLKQILHYTKQKTMKRTMVAPTHFAIKQSMLFAKIKLGFIRYMPLISSFLLAALFFYAAYNKLIIYQKFVEQLKASPITTGFESILAWLVPSVEILIGTALLFKRTRLIGLWSSFFLMMAFTSYVFVLLHIFKLHLCPCGGIISRLSWNSHFYFNLSFTMLAGIAVSLFPFTQKKP